MPFDLTLVPVYRIDGQEIASLPGLVVLMPTDNVASGRKHDRLIVYLLLTGNSTFSKTEYLQVAKDAANVYYQTPRSITSALRAATNYVNKTLLERNMITSAHGQYAIGWLVLAVLRDTQCTLSLSGPMHTYWFSQHEIRHVYEPSVSGKGLGANQTAKNHFAHVKLSEGDRLLFFGRSPSAWDNMLTDLAPSSLDAMYRRLTTLTSADLNAVLMQATDGSGVLNLLNQKDNELIKMANFSSQDLPFYQINLASDKPKLDSSTLGLEQKTPLRVFLCHASADKPVVRDLYKQLKAEGWITPWFDEEKIILGQHWATAIEDALDEADAVIIFLSLNSIKKEGFVQRELNYAWEISLEKPRDVIFLIPLRLDNCEVPRHLRSRQWGDYFGDKKEGTYQTLLRSLKERYLQKLLLDSE